MDDLLSEYHSDDCGETRAYQYRRIKTPKIKFAVKAERDAAVCLSCKDSDDDEMYEVSRLEVLLDVYANIIVKEITLPKIYF